MGKLKEWEPRKFFSTEDAELSSINAVLGADSVVGSYLKRIRRIYEGVFDRGDISLPEASFQLEEMLDGKKRVLGILTEPRAEWDNRNALQQLRCVVAAKNPLFAKSVMDMALNSGEPVCEERKISKPKASQFEASEFEVPYELMPFVDYLDEKFAEMFESIRSNAQKGMLKGLRDELIRRALMVPRDLISENEVELYFAVEEFFHKYSVVELTSLDSFPEVFDHIQRLWF